MKKVLMGFTVMIGMWISSTAQAQDYCRDQALDVLKSLYGESVEIQIIHVDGAGEGVHYWMKTNLCDSYIVASFVRNAPCRSPHAGEVPNYIRRVWAHGMSCQQILPQEIF